MSVNKQNCVFCRTNVNNPVALGQMEKTKNIYGHYYCILLSATITQSGRDQQGIWGFTYKDILNEVNRCKSKKCCYCFRRYASLKCSIANCHAYFHLPCGLRNKISIEFFDQYKTFCDKHRKRDGIPVDIRSTLGNQLCVICYEYLNKRDDESSVIWAPCCKTSVFHINCIRSMALNAGYFMKCPTCSNNDIFVKHLREYSVFVPERDASWETENGAYAELLNEHLQCDADHCLCTSGRNFNKKRRGPWNILKCKLCGSQGIHRACSIVPLNSNEFICATCKTIEDISSKNTNSTQPEINGQTQENDSNKTTTKIQPFENFKNIANLEFLVLNDITNNNNRSPKLNDSGHDFLKETPGCSSDEEGMKLIRHHENLSSCNLLKQVTTNTVDVCKSESFSVESSFDLNNTGSSTVHNKVARRRFSERLKRKYIFSKPCFK